MASFLNLTGGICRGTAAGCEHLGPAGHPDGVPIDSVGRDLYKQVTPDGVLAAAIRRRSIETFLQARASPPLLVRQLVTLRLERIRAMYSSSSVRMTRTRVWLPLR